MMASKGLKTCLEKRRLKMSLAELMGAEFGKEEAGRALTPLEVARMFHAAESKPRDCMLLKCIYFLGLSNSEVQNLRVKDIDFKGGRVRVTRGRKGRARYVLIPNGFGGELREFLGDERGHVFSGRSMGLLSDRHIRRIVKSYACKANVRKCEDIHPHSLRASHNAHMKSLTV
jgi:integrase